MTKLITVSKAKAEIKRLQEYIYLAESYEEDTLDKIIIKEYAYTNSISEIARRLNLKAELNERFEVTREYITTVIKSRPKDELQRFLRSGYMSKTKHSRRGTR